MNRLNTYKDCYIVSVFPLSNEINIFQLFPRYQFTYRTKCIFLKIRLTGFNFRFAIPNHHHLKYWYTQHKCLFLTWKRDDAYSSVPSPPKQITKSILLVNSSFSTDQNKSGLNSQNLNRILQSTVISLIHIVLFCGHYLPSSNVLICFWSPRHTGFSEHIASSNTAFSTYTTMFFSFQK